MEGNGNEGRNKAPQELDECSPEPDFVISGDRTSSNIKNGSSSPTEDAGPEQEPADNEHFNESSRESLKRQMGCDQREQGAELKIKRPRTRDDRPGLEGVDESLRRIVVSNSALVISKVSGNANEVKHRSKRRRSSQASIKLINNDTQFMDPMALVETEMNTGDRFVDPLANVKVEMDDNQLLDPLENVRVEMDDKTDNQNLSLTLTHTKGSDKPVGTVYTCTMCEYSSTNKWTLSRHKTIVHDKVRPFSCALCNYTATQRSSLTLHISAVHYRERPFPCSSCDYSASDKSSLNRHVSTVHNKERPYTCALCPYSAARKFILNNHVSVVHNKSRPFSCTMCDYSAAEKSSLTKHVSAVHNKERLYSCTLCPYSAARKYQLTQHISSVHTNKEKIFVCALCHYTGASHRNLSRHMAAVHR